MRDWRIKVLQGFKIITCPQGVFWLLVLLTVFDPPKASSQPLSPNLAGQGIRERNRAMDEHDRTINRMKNDAKAVNERRRNLFPQINEDFQRIQVIHNEMVRMLQPDKSLNYDRLAELSEDMKKRGNRLRTNLALPEPEKTKAQRTHSAAIDDSHMKQNIADLHDLIVSFVQNPIFKNLGVVDSKVIDSATQNLDNIIDMSDEIKREAKILGKSKKDPQ
jgi:hypothetical protein